MNDQDTAEGNSRLRGRMLVGESRDRDVRPREGKLLDQNLCHKIRSVKMLACLFKTAVPLSMGVRRDPPKHVRDPFAQQLNSACLRPLVGAPKDINSGHRQSRQTGVKLVHARDSPKGR